MKIIPTHDMGNLPEHTVYSGPIEDHGFAEDLNVTGSPSHDPEGWWAAELLAQKLVDPGDLTHTRYLRVRTEHETWRPAEPGLVCYVYEPEDLRVMMRAMGAKVLFGWEASGS